MARRLGEDVEDDRPRRIEGDRAAPGERQALALANPGDQRLGFVRIDRLGLDAAKAEDHRFVGRMAPAGEGERAHERDLDRRDPAERAALGEPGREGEGRLHRAHGVRRRGPDADLEELEDADHRFVRNVSGPSRGPAALGRCQSMTRFDELVIPRSERATEDARRDRKSILMASRRATPAISPKPEFSLLSPANRGKRAAP